jgi:4-hydroxybenzoyl-CoA reductase subunit beta
VLRLPKFEYLAPQTLNEAAKMLADYGPDAMAVAGGTDVYPKMKRRQFLPKFLIGLRHLKELKGIQGNARSGLVIKAGTSLTEVTNHPLVRESYAGLATATGVISTPILRNMGTIGGNLCLDTRCNYYDQTDHWRAALGWCMKAPGPQGWPIASEAVREKGEVPCRVAPGSPRCWAVSSTDSAPMFIALDAKVKLVSRAGERLIPVSELYRDDGMFYLNKRHDELVAEIQVPPADGLKSTYWKLRRRGSFDFPVLGVAAALKQTPDGTIEHAKIVLGGVGSHPMEMPQATQLLLRQKITPDLLEAVSQAVYQPARPLDNTDYHLFYRKRMTAVYVKRALQELAIG